MKRPPFIVAAAALVLGGLASCSSPLARESADHGQTRFEQQQQNYPDRLSSQQEAAAAERARQAERLGSP